MEFTRRNLTAAAGATAATTFTRTALGGWEPSERYPDPAIQILDPSFAKYRLALAGVERLATGMRWCEGPVYFGDARCLLWSDIPNNRIMRWEDNQLAKRRRGQIRRFGLVHRSAVRHPRQLRRARGHARAADQCLSARSEIRPCDGGGR